MSSSLLKVIFMAFMRRSVSSFLTVSPAVTTGLSVLKSPVGIVVLFEFENLLPCTVIPL